MDAKHIAAYWRSAVSVPLVYALFLTQLVTRVPGETAGSAGKRGSISVTAVCGVGCKAPKGAAHVYVLGSAEFESFMSASKDARVEGRELRSEGVTPVLVGDLRSGEYYVGVEAELDMSVIPAARFGETTVDKILEFFEDDLAVAQTVRLYVQDNRAVNCLGKWYPVSVRDGSTSRVIGLFLKRGTPLADWESFYPKEDRFTIQMSEGLLRSFWEKLETLGARTSSAEQDALTMLLAKGGQGLRAAGGQPADCLGR